MKRILITGAQGFVGRYLIHSLLHDESTHQILGIGRSPSQTEHLTHRVTWLGKRVFAPIPPGLDLCAPGRYRYEQADIRDRQKLVQLLNGFQPDWVFHLASGLRDDEPLDLCQINVEGATVVTQALVDAGCLPQMIVYGSTGAVYGHAQRLPLDEQTPTQPNDIYSATKLAAEHITRLLTRDNDLPAVWARLFNLTGPGQDERHACAYFASRLAAIASGNASPELSVGRLDPSRDFIDVRDAVSALVLLARRGVAGQVINIASGIEVTIGDVLATSLRLAGLEGRVAINQDRIRRFDISRQVAGIHRLRSLGFEPRFTLSLSLQDSLDYYRDVVRLQRESDAQQVHCYDTNPRC